MRGLLEVDDLAAKHLAAALGAHVRWLRDNGLSVPDALWETLQICDSWVSEVQGGSQVDEFLDAVHAARVMALLLTYDEVAGMLGVSVATVKRLVQSGELPKVKLGNAARVRRPDVESYVAGLAPSPFRARTESKVAAADPDVLRGRAARAESGDPGQAPRLGDKPRGAA